MNFVTENITPAKAQEYLKTSIGNRPISKVFVRSYADTMKQGKWLMNGMCIIFDNDGHLQDGHHRLHAVIEAGIPVRFDVIRGVTPQSFSTYDCGRHRTVSQLLAMQDVKNYNLVAAIVVVNDKLVRYGRLFENNAASNSWIKQTNADKYDLFRRDPEGYSAVASIFARLRGKCQILQCSWGGGLYYFLTHTGGYTEAEVLPFFEAIYSLDTSEIPVCDMLRKAIIKESISGRKMKAETLWAFIAKTWNHYITGTTPKFLRYKNAEELPQLKLK